MKINQTEREQMRYIKALLTLMLAAGALAAIAATTASATEGVLGSGTKFSGEQIGEGTLESVGGSTIKCTGGSILEGVITTDLTGTIGDIHFTGCKAFFFAANSLGDSSGIILTGKIKYEVCLINSATLEFGLFITPEKSTHIEVPSLGVLVVITGSLIASVLGNASSTTHEFHLAQSKGVPSPKTCTNDAGKTLTANQTLELSENGKPEGSGITALYKVTFNAAVEMMDK